MFSGEKKFLQKIADFASYEATVEAQRDQATV